MLREEQSLCSFSMYPMTIRNIVALSFNAVSGSSLRKRSNVVKTAANFSSMVSRVHCW